MTINIKYKLKKEKNSGKYYLHQDGQAQCPHGLNMCTSHCAQFEIINNSVSGWTSDGARAATIEKQQVKLWCSGRTIGVEVEDE
jgi:hypothetical protein